MQYDKCDFSFKAVAGIVFATLKTHGDHLGREKYTHRLVTADQTKCF